MRDDERRVHKRLDIELDVDCRVTTDSGTTDGQVRDLSYSGAFLRAAPGAAEAGETITVEFDLPGGEVPVTVLGEVVRLEKYGSQVFYALKFSMVEPKQRNELKAFVDSLMREAGQAGARPAIHRRIPIVCSTPEQIRDIINDIFSGGLRASCEIPVVVDEPVSVEIVAKGSPASLELPGHVAHVRRLDEAEAESVAFHVGVSLNELTAEHHRSVESFIQEVLSSAAGQ